jgi:hypothetical protein
MSECYDPIVTVAIPLTIMNMMGTALVILLCKCAEGFFYGQSPPMNFPTELSPLPEHTEISPEKIPSTIPETIPDKIPSTIPEKSSTEISDADLISQVRELLETPGFKEIYQPKESSETYRDQLKSQALTALNELSGEQKSIEDMTETLLLVTKRMAGTIDNATYISPNQRRELTELIERVPGLITKIVEMDDSEAALLQNNSTNSTKPRSGTEEAAFLMNTLESLRK